MNHPANQGTKSSLEAGAVNRSHRLFSLQELPADLSTCVHYHEKEGNSMPRSSSQWVVISSLVIGNSIVLLPSSISKSCCNILFWIHFSIFSEDSHMLDWVEARWIGGPSLPQIPITPLLLCKKAAHAALSAPAFPNCLLWPSSFQVSDSEDPSPSLAWLGAYLLCLYLSALFLSLYHLTGASYEKESFCLDFLYSRMVTR